MFKLYEIDERLLLLFKLYEIDERLLLLFKLYEIDERLLLLFKLYEIDERLLLLLLVHPHQMVKRRELAFKALKIGLQRYLKFRKVNTALTLSEVRVPQ